MFSATNQKYNFGAIIYKIIFHPKKNKEITSTDNDLAPDLEPSAETSDITDSSQTLKKSITSEDGTESLKSGAAAETEEKKHKSRTPLDDIDEAMWRVALVQLRDVLENQQYKKSKGEEPAIEYQPNLVKSNSI